MAIIPVLLSEIFLVGQKNLPLEDDMESKEELSSSVLVDGLCSAG